VKTGNILVIDEADKAPTNVTCILKSLVETGEMILSGRESNPAIPYTHTSVQYNTVPDSAATSKS
jgi:hypothetical protein